MIKQKFGSELDKWIQTLFPFLFRREVNPDTLTVIGTLVCVGAAGAYGAGEFIAGALLLWAGGLFDLVDGVVARHFGRSSAFGAFLDSTLDRLVDMAVLIALIIHYSIHSEVVTAVAAGVALVSSVLTSYTKARAESLAIDLPGGIIERGERIILLVAGGLFGIMVPVLWVLAIGASVTVVQRFMAARKGMASLNLADLPGSAERREAVESAHSEPLQSPEPERREEGVDGD